MVGNGLRIGQRPQLNQRISLEVIESGRGMKEHLMPEQAVPDSIVHIDEQTTEDCATSFL